MTNVAILTDSSAYLPPSLIEEYDIKVIPLVLVWGSEWLLDGVDITPDEFHRRLSEDPTLPTTTQPNPEDFLRIFDQLSKSCDGIVVPLISSELSGTVDSAKAAASEFDRVPVSVVDSCSTTMGLGFAALGAARAAAAGVSLDEVERAARTAASSVKVMFVVDTLEYLHRGGRIGGASRWLGTALSIKPILHLNEGRVDALEQVRTKKKAVSRMLDLAAEHASEHQVRAAVIHADAPDEADALASTVERLFDCLELYVTDLSPVIANHTGPGTLGLTLCIDEA